MLARDPPAVGFLRQMPKPVLDIRDEPLGGDQIPDGMVVLQRLSAPKNRVGHFAIEQDGSYGVSFRQTVGDRPQREVDLTLDFTETPLHQLGSDIWSQVGQQLQGPVEVAMSAGGRDRPLASLPCGDLRQPAEIFGQNVGRQRRREYRPADCLRILDAAEPIENVDLQPGDIAALEPGRIRTLDTVEGLLEPPRGDQAFGNLFDRRSFAAAQAFRRDVAVDVAARIGDVFQSDRQVSMLSGRSMV